MAERVDIKLTECIVRRGAKCGVGYAVRRNGDQEAKVFYAMLRDSKPRALAGLRLVFEELMKTGRVLEIRRFRKIRDRIWEAKHAASGARVFCFKHDGVWWATHGYMKDERKTPPAQIDRALEIMQEHIDRFWGNKGKGRNDE